MIVIDAKDQILGRLITRVAKMALRGEEVRIVNCEKAVVTGRKEIVVPKYQRKIHFGAPGRGPYYPRQSDRIVRRAVRGMLPYKMEKGMTAYKRVLCYVGVPSEFAQVKPMQFEEASLKNSNAPHYVYIGEVARLIGGSR